MTKQKKDSYEKGEIKDLSSYKGDGEKVAMIAELFRLFPYKRYSIKNLAHASGNANREERRDTARIVEQMVEKGVIEAVGSGKYMLTPKASEPVIGVVDMLASGSAFIKVEGEEQDIFIDGRNTAQAMNLDKVECIITHYSRNGVPEGRITKVLERSKRNYVGVLEVDHNHGYAFVKVDSPKVPMDIYVGLKDGQKLKSGQKVLVRIIEWAEGSRSPVGEIVDVFGMAGEHNAEMHAILAEYDLPYRFEKEVSDAANAIRGEITEKDYAERRDMRTTPTFTIDPANAKDFDDALSVKKLGNGLFEIGVHIADVTHYVTPGSIVDTEAEERATSVYLVDRTVPMLPERLSNTLCSLRPNEEKLAFSAIFEIDEQADIKSQWFGRTVIMSDRRYTYEEAQTIIEGAEGEFKNEVLTLHNLALKLREERFRNGAISFDREEAKFKLDKDGKPLGVYFTVMKEANHLIEEFMLLANRRVAEFVGGKTKDSGGGAAKGEKRASRRTFVYRVHDEPNEEKLSKFKSFIMRFGYNFDAGGGPKVSKELNRVMGEIKGKSEENLISTLAIRTMSKAYYTTENIGHYGLAFKHYSHFTSPIRRYPDMMAHRLLANYLAGGKSPKQDEYEQLCEHSSDMEVRAAEAERASIKYKMVEFMMDRIGEEFEGHISGVTEWGIYVELDDTHIEGMVSMRDMSDDFYDFNEEEYAVVGRSTGRKFTLGDAVKIKILRADLVRKQLDFQMTASIDFKTGRVIEVEEQLHPREGGRAGGGGSGGGGGYKAKRGTRSKSSKRGDRKK